MNDLFDSPSYKRSRVAYHIQCVTEYLVTLLVADAFLAKLLKQIGLSDSTIGIVSSLMSLAFLVQLGTIFLMQHISNVKKAVILIDITSSQFTKETAGRKTCTARLFHKKEGDFKWQKQ